MVQDYVTDVPYTAGFYGEQSPLYINYVMALNGIAPRRLDAEFTYCELGSGQGVTTNTLAVCHPDARFVGIDFNPEHIRNARATAEAGQIRNVTFIDKSITDLDQTDLPDFDFITLHGVYSWVSEETRRAIVELLKRKLKPGGAAYVSYNAMPGWSALAPLREIMMAFTAQMKVDSLEKARQGVAYLQFLRDRKAKYFSDNPSANAMLDFIMKHPINYVAHEYFNQHWNPMYVGQVAREMAAGGLSFAGNVPILLNYRDASVPKEFQEVFATAPDRVVFEIHRDFVRNEQFRRDIYVKADRPPLRDQERRPLFDGFNFGTCLAREALSTKVNMGGAEVSLTGAIYPALIAALASGTKTLAELRADPTLAAFTDRDIFDGARSLVLGGQFVPFVRSVKPAAQASATRLAIPQPFNRVMIETRLFAGLPLYLASPTLGNGVLVSMLDALAMLALTNAPASEAPEWAWSLLQRAGRSLMHNNVAVQGKEPHIAHMRSTIDSLLGPRLAKFQELGIVVPA